MNMVVNTRRTVIFKEIMAAKKNIIGSPNNQSSVSRSSILVNASTPSSTLAVKSVSISTQGWGGWQKEISHDKYDVHGIAHACTDRKDDIFMQRQLYIDD